MSGYNRFRSLEIVLFSNDRTQSLAQFEAVENGAEFNFVWVRESSVPVLPETVPFLVEGFRRKLRRFAFIDNAGHFGGLAAGLLLGWLLFRMNEQSVRKKKRLIEYSGAAALLVLGFIAAYAVYRMAR